MAYTTTALVKTYLGISGAGDDTLIGNLVTYAQKMIDTATDRTFEASADTTRYFTVGKDTDGRTLYLDRDLCSITTITNLADGGTPDTLAAAEYVTEPRNATPYHAIRLLGSSGLSWDYADDPETGISILGKWAYSTAAPSDIVHACTRLAAYLYRQKDAQVFDVTAITDAGSITAPGGIPADVAEILAPYVRRVM